MVSVTEVVERVSIPFDIYLCPHNLKYVILLGLLPPPFIPQHAFWNTIHLETIVMPYKLHQETPKILAKSIIYGSIFAPIIHVIHRLYTVNDTTTDFTIIEYIVSTIKYFYMYIGAAIEIYFRFPPFFIIPMFFIFIIYIALIILRKSKAMWGVLVLTLIVIVMLLTIRSSASFLMM